ncbi:MAG TPA: glycosyltransferase family 2 protein [Pirellulales bacterium]|jgi:hypothetical protein|nr:glycosyltransferase family 2 protein [Pirellulales bacterium]
MSLLIVIVNYRTADLAIDCLRSLDPEVRSLPGARVVVADNASPDDSVARLESAVASHGWSEWAAVRRLQRNGGFAYGNNEVLREALRRLNCPDLFLLLNPDTVVRPGALRALVEAAMKHPKIGIFGSRLEHPDGAPQCSAFRFPSLPGELDDALRLGLVSRLLRRWCVAPPPRGERHPADWVAGASMLVRREVFDSIGLLDERYFMYYEEVDFCRRARAARWACSYEPSSRVVHLVGQASGVTDRTQRRRRPAYWFDSRRRYFLKHHGRTYTALTDFAWAAGFFAWRCRRWVQRKVDCDPPSLLADFIRHSSLVRGFKV